MEAFDDTINIDDMADKYTFSYFVNSVWDWNEDRDAIAAYKDYIAGLEKKEDKFKYAGWSFITLSPDHNKRKIEYNDNNIQHLKDFCNAWFNETNYSAWAWVVESGKNSGDPHLHIHCFCRIKNPRHHKRDLITMWCKFFPKLIDSDYHIVKCNTKDMYVDKQNYLINDRKGTHMNFEDLSGPPNFAMGSSGVITSK